ncbi:hypothetical protein SAMN05428977_10018 [Nitrosomonas sp. Nm166]|nr:hypothetical protein SAMN05428977_10018 [Nitrosomonas sp. Nm166]
MAFRLKFSARALREIGEARTWYEMQSPGLGEEFVAAIALQLKRLEQAPLLLCRSKFPKCIVRSFLAFPMAYFMSCART